MSEIKITGSQLDSMFDVLRGIGNYSDLPFNMRIAANLQKFETAYKRRQKSIYEETDKLVEKDEKGVWKEKEGRPVYINLTAANKAFMELDEKELTIEVKEIDYTKYPEAAWNRLPANMLSPLLGLVITNWDVSTLKLSK